MNLDPKSSLRESKFDPESKIKNWPWVIIQIQKNNKIYPESKIKTNLELKIQDQNCEPESMSSKHFFLDHFMDVASNNIFFEAILRNCILTWHSFGATFRSCISTLSLWGNSTELYSQNIFFKTTLWSRIIQKSL